MEVVTFNNKCSGSLFDVDIINSLPSYTTQSSSSIFQEPPKTKEKFKTYCFTFSNVSSFDIQENSDFNVIELWKAELNEFRELINNRVDYIEKLKDLDNDWISGKCEAPKLNILGIFKNILLHLYEHINTSEYLSIPHLIMGPIPSGGFSMEIDVGNFSSEKKILVSAYNNGSFDIEYEHDEIYSSLCPESDKELLNQLTEVYANLIKAK